MIETTKKIASLNLCLGLKNKKEAVKRLILENNIEIMCLQETEVPLDFPTDLLTFKGFNYENENNQFKSRCGIYVSNKISYLRRTDLEVVNMHLMIIDINDPNKTRIINIYRPFNPVNGMTQKDFFEAQLAIIKDNFTTNSIILGDFNLDQSKILDHTYSHKNYFTSLNDCFSHLNLIQLVKFETWSRIINNVVITSTIDHVYVKDPTKITSVYPIIAPFGDHKLIMVETMTNKSPEIDVFRRNWKNYTPIKLANLLHKTDWQINFDSVQAYWNAFESKLIEITDKIAPLEKVGTNKIFKITPPRHIKNKINRRNRLLKKIKSNPNPQSTRQEIKDLNKEIKTFFFKSKSKNVRKGIIPGNSKSLWDAVKKAKDINSNTLPDFLFQNNIKINKKDHATTFANFFSDKVNSIVNQTVIDPNIYNGNPKVNTENKFFMTSTDILECLKTIKNKNCEGYDRIPQRILSDGANELIIPLTGLFQRIYTQKIIPEQWSISKVIPIHKKAQNAILKIIDQ